MYAWKEIHKELRTLERLMNESAEKKDATQLALLHQQLRDLGNNIAEGAETQRKMTHAKAMDDLKGRLDAVKKKARTRTKAKKKGGRR